MKIKNPDWHPKSWAELTVAQRNNLRLIGLGQKISGGRAAKSFASLLRHNLVVGTLDTGTITGEGLRLLHQGGFPVADSAFGEADPTVRPIEWCYFGARVQAHGLCQYCGRHAEYMRKISDGKKGRWVALCKFHASKD